MIRNAFAVCALPVAIVALMVVAGACSGDGQDSAAEEQQEGQPLATEPFELEPGLAIVEMNHQGGGDFAVNLLSARQEEAAPTSEPIVFSGDQSGGENTEAAFALAKKTGPVNVSKAVNVPAAGEHLLEVKADGPWTIKVEQPRPSSAPETSSFSGNHDTATPFFRLSSGPKRVTTTNPREENLEISLLDKDGNAVKPAFVNETDQAGLDPSSNVSTTVDIDEDGIYLFNVRTDGLWTIQIEDVEESADAEQPGTVGWDTNTPTGSDILLAILINLVWFLILFIVTRSRDLERKRST